MAGCARGCMIPSARVCSEPATSDTSATGAAGTPAAVSISCHSAVSRSRSRAVTSGISASRFRTRSGFVRKRSSARELRKLECVAQEPEQPVVSGRDHELAVARREHLVGSDHREAGSLPRRHGAVREEADEVVPDVAEGGLVQGRVDERAGAAALALEQGGDDAERRPHARPHVDQRRADAHARPPRLARHADEAAGRLHERVVTRLGRERPDVPVGADRAVDEALVASAQRVGAEAHALREPGPKALEEHVRAVDEAQDGVPAALVAQRDGERALARVHGQEHRALAVPEGRAPRTCVVPGVRPLDLDHVGAERGEDLRAVRAGDRRRHVDDAHARDGGGADHPCPSQACLSPRPWGRIAHSLAPQGQTLVSKLAHCAAGLCEDAPVPDWLDFDRFTEWVSGEWWSYLVIFGVAVVDAFFPLVPSESLVVIGGNLASSGDLVLWLVILSGAAGAIVGDNISFWLGHFVGEKTVKRVFASEKWHKRLEWAERTLDERGAYIILIARFIPGGRTAVTFSAGYVNTFPWRRFIVYDIVAGVLWATYAALLGYFGGKTFEDHPLWGVALALGIALTLGFVVEAVRHYRQRRQAT